MSDREVKTRQTFDEWRAEKGFVAGKYDHETIIRREAWGAALASVETTGRFEVGHPARANYRAGLKPGPIAFVPDDNTLDIIFDPFVVRPLPKTVELTVNEKIRELATAMLNKIEPTTSDAVAHNLIGIHIEISLALANGKTLDQLCSEYGVSTTKELS